METDNTIEGMKNEMNKTKLAYEKELEQKNQLIKEIREKEVCNMIKIMMKISYYNIRLKSLVTKCKGYKSS